MSNTEPEWPVPEWPGRQRRNTDPLPQQAQPLRETSGKAPGHPHLWPVGSEPQQQPVELSLSIPRFRNPFVRATVRVLGSLLALASIYLVGLLGTMWGGIGVFLGFLVMFAGLFVYWLGWRKPGQRKWGA